MTARTTISRSTLCDDIALLTFEAPAQAASFLTQSCLTEFERNLDSLEADQRISGVAIASGHPNQSLFGPDLGELTESQQAEPDLIIAFMRRGQTVLRRLSQSRLATLAVIQGTCRGGGRSWPPGAMDACSGTVVWRVSASARLGWDCFRLGAARRFCHDWLDSREPQVGSRPAVRCQRPPRRLPGLWSPQSHLKRGCARRPSRGCIGRFNRAIISRRGTRAGCP